MKTRRRLELLGSLIVLGLSFLPSGALADTCSTYASHKNLLAQTGPGAFASNEAWAEFKAAQAQAKSVVSDRVFSDYIEGRATFQAVRSCFRSAEWAAIEESLPYAFYRGSFLRLQSINDAKVRAFANQAIEWIDSGRLIHIGLQAPSSIDPHTNLLFGGFHRGQQGLYLNPEQLPPRDWYMILIHEFAHAMDPLMSQAVAESKRDFGSDDAFLSRLSRLSGSEQRALIDRFVLNGLDRGLLAEYRAWTVTASLYRQLLQMGQIGRIQWMDQMMPASSGRGQIARSVFDFLDRQFSDPAEGVFSDPQLYSRLQEIRQSMRRETPRLGQLQTFVHD